MIFKLITGRWTTFSSFLSVLYPTSVTTSSFVCFLFWFSSQVALMWCLLFSILWLLNCYPEEQHTSPLYHFITCQLICVPLLRNKGCFHLPVSLFLHLKDLFFPLAPGFGTREIKAEGGAGDSGWGGGGEREMWSIIRFFSLCEMALCGVPLDQSRPRAFLQMINNFTFNWKPQS